MFDNYIVFTPRRRSKMFYRGIYHVCKVVLNRNRPKYILILISWGIFIQVLLMRSKTHRHSHEESANISQPQETHANCSKILNKNIRPPKYINQYTSGNLPKPPEFKQFAKTRDLPFVHQKDETCVRIINGDREAFAKAKVMDDSSYLTRSGKDEELYNLVSNCGRFLRTRKYLTRPVNSEEAKFPVAFSILGYKDAFQIERLLHTIYRPQNIYCIHIDTKAPDLIFEIMKQIGNCLPNILVINKDRINVSWGRISVLQADLICMKHLLQKHPWWKYFINLTGQEFPLKTNLEVVKVLTVFSGSNDVEAHTMTEYELNDRVRNYPVGADQWMLRPFTHNITFYKGSVHIAASRGFVDFIVSSVVAQDLLEYLRHSWIPDETFFATLSNNPQLGVPGSYTGCLDVTNQSVIRYKLWMPTNQNISRTMQRKSKLPANPVPEPTIEIKPNEKLYYSYMDLKCHGKVVRNICVCGLGDLIQMTHTHKLFVNKLDASYSPVTSHCLEEYIWNKVAQEIRGIHTLDLNYYKHIDYVQNHL